MGKTTFTRQELYDLVWREPRSALAKRFNISDVGIAKICKKMKIPMPPLGYWARVRSGQPLKKKKLPENYEGESEVTLDQRTLDEENLSPVAVHWKQRKEIESDTSLPLTVPESLIRPDKITVSTKKYFVALKKYERSRDKSISHPIRQNVFDINVTNALFSRALLVMDAIIKLLRARNHEINADRHKTVATLYGEETQIRIFEKNYYIKSEDKYGYMRTVPSGKLAFGFGEYYYAREVVDTDVPLEEKLSSILASMESKALIFRRERIIREKIWAEQKEKERIILELKERKQKELADFKNLFFHAIQHSQANYMRDYVKSIKEDASKNGSLSDDLIRWAEWANDKIDWYDPRINRADSLLDDFKKIDVMKDFLK